jgi:hypothetical protein
VHSHTHPTGFISLFLLFISLNAFKWNFYETFMNNNNNTKRPEFKEKFVELTQDVFKVYKSKTLEGSILSENLT